MTHPKTSKEVFFESKKWCRVETLYVLQQVLDIEQSMLLEAYTQFVSKVEQKPKESVEEAKKWMMGQLLQQGFQVTFLPFLSSINSLAT